MSLEEKTIELQRAFSNMCKQGKKASIEGASIEGMKTYQRLVFSNIQNTLEKAYPITKELLKKDEWEGLTRDFFAAYPIKSPHLWEMPKDLYLFVKEEGHPLEHAFPFLEDLLHFEWLEIAFFIMPDHPCQEVNSTGHLVEDPLVLNPEHRIVSFAYPVFRQNIRGCIENKGNYFLLVYRTHKAKEVRYFELSPLHVVLWEKVKEEGLTVAEAIAEAGQLFPQIPFKRLLPSATDFFQKLMEEEAVLGFKL